VLHAREALASDGSGEDEVGEQVVAARRVDAGEADAGLEGDARARRVDGDRALGTHGAEQRVERLAQPGCGAGEVLVEALHRARVRQVARDERLPAVGAAPQRVVGGGGHWSPRVAPAQAMTTSS
jgi:hypothetical protein